MVELKDALREAATYLEHTGSEYSIVSKHHGMRMYRRKCREHRRDYHTKERIMWLGVDALREIDEEGQLAWQSKTVPTTAN